MMAISPRRVPTSPITSSATRGLPVGGDVVADGCLGVRRLETAGLTLSGDVAVALNRVRDRS
jgi:hypothetical protein